MFQALKTILFLALRLAVFAAPALLLYVDLPLKSEHLTDETKVTVLGISYLFILSCYASYLIAKRHHTSPALHRATYVLALGIFAGLAVLFFSATITINLLGSFLLVLLIAAVLTLCVTLNKQLEFAGLLGFILACTLVGALELTLDRIPNGYLIAQIEKTPPLYGEDQVNIVYKKNWFRGKRPCTKCPEDFVRILTMGGSSTNGVPMRYSNRTYSAELQRLLDERRPGENYEVLNGGVAAFGIVQVISALKEELLKFEPDIVTVCSWFNDSAANNRWYRFPGVSDKEGYERSRALMKLQELPGYKQLRDTRLFGLTRYSLLGLRSVALKREQLRKKTKRPRMTPEEFEWGLRQVVTLANKHNFLPMFVLEPLNRPRDLETTVAKNGYFKRIYEVADEESVPVVDTISRMHENPDAWLFYDFIHPNVEGHKLIAETIYDSLFSEEQTERSKAFWLSRGIDYQRPHAQRRHRRQFVTEDVRNKKLLIKARAPFIAEYRGKLSVHTSDGAKIAEFDSVTADFADYEVPLGSLRDELPITDIELRGFASATSDNPAYRIGSTNTFSPVFIEATSGGRDHGWTGVIEVNGQRHDYDHRGYNVVVIGAKSGTVLSTGLFDIFRTKRDNARFVEYLKNLSKFEEDGTPPVVVIIVKTDGGHHTDRDAIPPLLRSLGGTGRLPKTFESFLLIGTPGASRGSAIEELGPKLIHVEVGSRSRIGADLIEVASIDVVD